MHARLPPESFLHPERPMPPFARTLFAVALVGAAPLANQQAQESAGVTYEGAKGSAAAPLPGNGKKIVLLAGDEEYRSEEALPMLAKILAVHHGFRCTVLFSTDPKSGAIDPDQQTHVPGLAALDDADLAIVFWRFRELPDADMKHFVDYVESGKPLIGIRTATHAFQYQRDKKSPYAKWSFDSTEWPGGFGQQILGDTWVAHHGAHGSQSTRGVVDSAHADHPILRGVKDVWGPTDVYAITHLLPTDVVLLRGQVLQGMQPTDPPVEGGPNAPMMPLMWCREIGTAHAAQRVVAATIGAAVDLQSSDLRRAFVNAAYWSLHLEAKIDPKSDVSIVGDYAPTFFGFGKAKKGVMPAEHALPAERR
jgi:type 1 glutamine amidotransferase